MVSTTHNLKEVRQNEGLSAAKLASLSGVSERAVRDIENGKRPGSAVTWGKIIIGLNKNPEKSRAWKLSDFNHAQGEVYYDSTTRPAFLRVKEPTMIDIDEVAPIGETALAVSSFWRSKSFDELAAEQGVLPITNFDELSMDWPEDADFDSFLAAVRSARD